MKTDTSDSGALTAGAGFSSRALTKPKTLAFTPIPMANVSSASAVNPGAFEKERSAYRQILQELVHGVARQPDACHGAAGWKTMTCQDLNGGSLSRDVPRLSGFGHRPSRTRTAREGVTPAGVRS